MNEILQASIDIETTGLNEGYHEMIELAITQFDDNLDPTGIKFVSYVKPSERGVKLAEPKAVECNGLDLELLHRTAPTPSQVRYALIQWKEELFGSAKIMPLGHNFASFDKVFLKLFMTPDIYNEMFDYHIRDTFVLAQSLIDAGKIKCSTSMHGLCDFFNIEYKNAHSAYGDTLLTLQVYKCLINLLK